MMAHIVEQAKNIPIAYETDVLVVGGGATGVAAAIAAARVGCDVMLVEKYGFCGGMATAGMSGTICGLFTSGKTGKREQLVHGFAGEFYRHLQDRGGVSDPFPFGDTALVVHDLHVWKEVADDLLTEAKVKILYHTYCVGIVHKNGLVEAAIIENKSGRKAIRAKRFVDATGDGDLCVWAGAPHVMGKNGSVQYPTMVFRMNHVDVQHFLRDGLHRVEELIHEAERKGFDLPRKHIYLLPSPRPGEILCNVTRIAKENGDPIDATNAEDLTEAELRGRKQVREYERFLRQFVPGFENARLNDVAAQIGIRQSRTILGKGMLRNEDVMQARKSKRAVAKSAWCIEAHGKDGIYMYYLDNDYYEIPFDTLVPQNVENVMTAGRTLSAEHEALASARVTAQCFLTGYAAGAASALSLKHGIKPGDVDYDELKSVIDY
ncbi:MAG: hypothetical protein BAA02_10235 [Paenibacillaceae bacterium ZCTH02-B3]|nr:MAG: hypothetical protein BAA02_10235 [Paenibacillaceae bacterium ZCTH02-B3]